jgi:hypothetical protein
MIVDDSPPDTPKAAGAAPPPTGGLALVNPLLGAAYAMKLGKSFWTNFFFGMTAPIGMGGGAAPDAGEANARNKGINARAALDNSLFAVNDLAVIPGVSFAYVGNNLLTTSENRRKRCIEGTTEKWRRLAASRSRSLRPRKMKAQGLLP